MPNINYRPLTPSRKNLAYVLSNLLAASLVLVPFYAFWGGTIQWKDLAVPDLWFVLAVLASVFVHEGLHALGLLVFCKAPLHSISIILDWKNIKYEARCTAPVTARSFRWMALLPAIVLAFVPACLAWIYGNGWLAAWSVLMFNGATFDFIKVWEIRSLESSNLVAMEEPVSSPTQPEGFWNG